MRRLSVVGVAVDAVVVDDAVVQVVVLGVGVALVVHFIDITGLIATAKTLGRI